MFFECCRITARQENGFFSLTDDGHGVTDAAASASDVVTGDVRVQEFARARVRSVTGTNSAANVSVIMWVPFHFVVTSY